MVFPIFESVRELIEQHKETKRRIKLEEDPKSGEVCVDGMCRGDHL